VTFAVDKVLVALVSVPVLRFPQSLSFHQRFVLIFIFLVLLLEGQTVQAWEPSTKTVLFKLSGSWDRTLPIFASFFLLYELLECETLPVVSVHNCSMFK